MLRSGSTSRDKQSTWWMNRSKRCDESVGPQGVNQPPPPPMQVDKLNAIISSMEKSMLKLRKQYEVAIESRNYTGITLIDRNDELCILYEKNNIQVGGGRQSAG